MNNQKSPNSPSPLSSHLPGSRQLVPEFVQEAADADAIATAALRLLAHQSNSERVVMLQGYERLKALLGKEGASKEAALHVLTSIGAIDGG